MLGRRKLIRLIVNDDLSKVRKELKAILRMVDKDFAWGRIFHVFDDISSLFSGEYPGYRPCNTTYHDLRHTMDAFMVMVRMMHGAHAEGQELSNENITLGAVATLLHDTGYIQTEDDTTGTGAKYTLSHIERSIEFMETYFRDNGFETGDLDTCTRFLKCTGLNTKISSVEFTCPQEELLGKMLGAADLIGQMADRYYLEKLLFLFYEFQEGSVPGFEGELDLLQKTLGFFDIVRKRISRDLSGVDRYLRFHFINRWKTDVNPYDDCMEKNLLYLKYILENKSGEYRRCLRRGGFVEKLITSFENGACSM